MMMVMMMIITTPCVQNLTAQDQWSDLWYQDTHLNTVLSPHTPVPEPLRNNFPLGTVHFLRRRRAGGIF